MAIGKVIKSDGGGELDRDRPLARPRAGVMNAEQFEARQSAQAIVAEAKRQAAEIIAKAERERDQFVAEAREQGRQEGLQQVSEQLARAHWARGEMIKQLEPQAVELALKIAEKIIGRVLDLEPSFLVEMSATAVENVRHAKAMVLRVNPKVSAFMRERMHALLQAIGRSVDLAIKDDPDVEPQGCVIQTEFGTIDAQLTTQLQMLKEVLLPDNARKDGPQ